MIYSSWQRCETIYPRNLSCTCLVLCSKSENTSNICEHTKLNSKEFYEMWLELWHWKHSYTSRSSTVFASVSGSCLSVLSNNKLGTNTRNEGFLLYIKRMTWCLLSGCWKIPVLFLKFGKCPEKTSRKSAQDLFLPVFSCFICCHNIKDECVLALSSMGLFGYIYLSV